MFPKAMVVRWSPVPPRLKGKALDASLILNSMIDAGALDAGFISYGSIAKVMPGKGGTVKPMPGKHFNRMADGDAWRDHLAGLGLIECTHAVGDRSPTRGVRACIVDELPEWLDSTEA
jgi:hypothetical protein